MGNSSKEIKGFKRVNIESKKNKNNIAEITRRLIDLADLLDAQSNTDSGASITSKKRRRRRKVKKSKGKNSDGESIPDGHSR